MRLFIMRSQARPLKKGNWLNVLRLHQAADGRLCRVLPSLALMGVAVAIIASFFSSGDRIFDVSWMHAQLQ